MHIDVLAEPASEEGALSLRRVEGVRKAVSKKMRFACASKRARSAGEHALSVTQSAKTPRPRYSAARDSPRAGCAR